VLVEVETVRPIRRLRFLVDYSINMSLRLIVKMARKLISQNASSIYRFRFLVCYAPVAFRYTVPLGTVLQAGR
jgi:hypothetical protein